MTTPHPGSREAAQALDEMNRDGFLVIHEGDGRHATVCAGYKEAADAAVQGMWAGTVQSALEEDECLRHMHAAVLNPDSDQWEDGDGKSLYFDFEDGHLRIVRIPVFLPTLRAALAPPADVAGEVEEIRERLNDRKPSGPRGHVPPLTQSERDMATLLRLLSEERARRVEVEDQNATLKGAYTIIAKALADAQHKDTQDE